MIEIDDFIVKISASFEAFNVEIERVTGAIERLGDAMLHLTRFRLLTVPGRWAYKLATRLGFAKLDVLAWLETCPGAFADEFQEEHWS